MNYSNHPRPTLVGKTAVRESDGERFEILAADDLGITLAFPCGAARVPVRIFPLCYSVEYDHATT